MTGWTLENLKGEVSSFQEVGQKIRLFGQILLWLVQALLHALFCDRKIVTIDEQ